ncbi:CHAT domain-containing protein [Collybia nuda]|uniref:CHAT domain-containing protein n=1 Tax=Collybia nuda TaxID=64659 RepID=A0A9P5Y7W0_9AGAR|nr:CHAT domain-containing protein [Collybia nuda]
MISMTAQPGSLRINVPVITGKTIKIVFQDDDEHSGLSELSLGDPNLASGLSNFSSMSCQRFITTGDSKDLERGLRFGLAAISAFPKGSPFLPFALSNISKAYGTRYEKTGNLNDFEAMVRYEQEAVALIPLGHPFLPSLCYDLSTSYGSLFARTGNILDVDFMLRYMLASVAASPKEHPDLPKFYQDLPITYSKRYKRTGNVEDLEAALKYGLIAMAAIQERGPRLIALQTNIAVFYYEWYNQTGNLLDLELALKYALEAVNSTPEGVHPWPDQYQNLALFYKTRFRRTGDQQNLQTALEYGLKAISMYSEGHPSLPSHYCELAEIYKDKFRMFGNLPDLENALQYDLAAVNATPEGHPDQADQWQNLAKSYNYRYKRTGNFEDLDAALKYGLAAVMATPEDHPGLPGRQSDLAVTYRDKYIRSKEVDNLKAALKYSLAALAAIPDGHPSLSNLHHDLGIYYSDMFDKYKDQLDLDTALKHTLLSVTTTPEGHPEISFRYYTLSITYKIRYHSNGDAQDSEAALKYCLAAVTTSPDGHPDRPIKQAILAENYLDRVRLRGKGNNQEDANSALQQYQLALQSVTTSPQHIWKVARNFVRNVDIFESSHILQAYDIALKVLPSVLWLGNSLGVRHDILVRYNVSEFISMAVVTALEASDIRLAVEYLEQGLATTYQQMLQLKVKNGNLEAELPSLSKKLHVLSAQLQGTTQSFNPSVNFHLLAHERLQLISEIREHPGFEDFLMPPRYSNLCLAAKDGPVIMLNYTNGRADAIIILTPFANPIHLLLSEVTATAVEEQMKQLSMALRQFHINSREIRHGRPMPGKSNIPADRILNSVTSWIWRTIVEPVFDILNKNDINGGRLWWCPSGPFTYLPLHSAAPIDSKFIQSYTSTLDTLIQASSRHAISHAHETLTVVGVMKLSVDQMIQAELPYVGVEINNVASQFGINAKKLCDSQATIKNVVKEMQLSPWLHIASHGVQDPQDPLHSGLILYDGRLELSTVLNLSLPNAKFVYLSACETAMGDEKLKNEAMHLAGGFLTAGFQGAIGTLWSIPDAYGPKVAEVVYQTILGENYIPDVKMVAMGLHLAIQRLRREGAPHHQWMPFIHFGV